MNPIKPPRKPRGENKSTTIALQEKQIKQLIDRVQELAQERDSLQLSINGEKFALQALAGEMKDLKDQLDSSEAQKRDMGTLISHMEGYQDCAREIFERIIKK